MFDNKRKAYYIYKYVLAPLGEIYVFALFCTSKLGIYNVPFISNQIPYVKNAITDTKDHFINLYF